MWSNGSFLVQLTKLVATCEHWTSKLWTYKRNPKYLKQKMFVHYLPIIVAKHGPRDVNHFSTCSVSLFYIWVSGRAIVHFSLFRVAFQVVFLVTDNILCMYNIIDFGKEWSQVSHPFSNKGCSVSWAFSDMINEWLSIPTCHRINNPVLNCWKQMYW